MKEVMKKVFNKTFQVGMDILVGIAVYFGVNAFIPSLSNNLAIVVTLISTAIFAEFVELRLKK